SIDIIWISSQNICSVGLKRFCSIVWCLTAYGDNDAKRIFEIVDIGDSFKSKFFKVKFIGNIVVSGNRFWIAINHNRIFLLLLQVNNSVNTCPIKLYRGPYAIWSGPKHYNTVFALRFYIIMVTIVGEVEVICFSWKFAS